MVDVWRSLPGYEGLGQGSLFESVDVSEAVWIWRDLSTPRHSILIHHTITKPTLSGTRKPEAGSPSSALYLLPLRLCSLYYELIFDAIINVGEQ